LEFVAFCCDVDAGEPSLSQLKEARKVAERFVQLSDTIAEREKDIKAIRTHSYRWTAGYINFAFHVLAETDTLAEMMAMVEGGEK
jgi:hypothetical protein